MEITIPCLQPSHPSPVLPPCQSGAAGICPKGHFQRKDVSRRVLLFCFFGVFHGSKAAFPAGLIPAACGTRLGSPEPGAERVCRNLSHGEAASPSPEPWPGGTRPARGSGLHPAPGAPTISGLDASNAFLVHKAEQTGDRSHSKGCQSSLIPKGQGSLSRWVCASAGNWSPGEDRPERVRLAQRGLLPYRG